MIRNDWDSSSAVPFEDKKSSEPVWWQLGSKSLHFLAQYCGFLAPHRSNPSLHTANVDVFSSTNDRFSLDISPIHGK